MAAPNPKDVKALNDLLAEQDRNLSGINKKQQQSQILAQQRANIEKAITEHQKAYLEGNRESEAAIRDLNVQLDKVTDEEKQINKELDKQVTRRKLTVDLARQLGNQLKTGWKYLQDQDKIIKSVNLNLGMSQAKAAAMRDSFEQSAGYVTRLGGTISDIGTVMQGYADETGRARVMTADMVKDITAIGKGTGLGIQEATRLGAQFELMGFDAKSTMDYVQGVVDTSERMGVNTTKVLKVVNDNFKKLNTYTFQQGVKGFAEMAMYAEKFRIDIGQALNAADVARSLEGAIDLTAQLQVMGGEFAKTDPFEMLFLSRNDPAKFTEKIADMTKGLVSFRKMADGTFEKFISPADRDRLAAVAQSMGMEASALTEIAERQAEIQKMRNEMAGLGLSPEQKELIEGAAIFNKESGKFQVQVGDTMKNISELTKDQAKAFATEQVSLEERAKQAMTFNETFQATIETLKAALLPILKAVNKALVPVAKVADWMSTLAGTHLGWLKAGGILLAAGTAWKAASFGLSAAVGSFTKSGMGKTLASKGILGGGGAKGIGDVVSTQGSKSGLFEQRKGIGMGAAAKGQGMKNLGTGAGVGAAGAGMGAGIMLAAKGISQLADSMAKLNADQIKGLTTIATTLAITFPLAAIGITLAGKAAEASAVGLIVLGGAIALVGAGIFLATKGIGSMASGLAELNNSGGGAGKEILGVAAGVGALTVAMMTGGVPALFAFNNGLKRMDKHSDGVEAVGTAFKNIHAVLSGSRDDFEAVEKAVKSIGGTNIKSGGYFAELSNLLKKPLQVEFANNGRVALQNDITLNLDGQKFMQKSYDVNIAVQKHESLKHGKGS